MKNKKRVLEFASEYLEIPDVKPAKGFIPEWYKSIKGYNNNNIKFNDDMRYANIKSCMPFLDTLTSGYMVELWTDIHVTGPAGNKLIRWASQPDPLGMRKDFGDMMPAPKGYSDQQFGWRTVNIVKLPPGYSMLMTHPFNRLDLPFITVSGIVDLDTVLGEGNFPFFIRDDFEGVIPAGTPIYQILPFKRENWVSVKNQSIVEESERTVTKIRRKFYGYYKANIWKKKLYD